MMNEGTKMTFGGTMDKMNVTVSSGGRYHSSADKMSKRSKRKTNLSYLGGRTSFDEDGYYEGSAGRKPRKKWQRIPKREISD